MKTLERHLGLILVAAFLVSAATVGGAIAYTQHTATAPTSGLWQWLMNPDKGHGNTKVA